MNKLEAKSYLIKLVDVNNFDHSCRSMESFCSMWNLTYIESATYEVLRTWTMFLRFSWKLRMLIVNISILTNCLLYLLFFSLFWDIIIWEIRIIIFAKFNLIQGVLIMVSDKRIGNC